MTCKVSWGNGIDTIYTCTKEVQPEEIVKQEPEAPVNPEVIEEEKPHYKYKI